MGRRRRRRRGNGGLVMSGGEKVNWGEREVGGLEGRGMRWDGDGMMTEEVSSMGSATMGGPAPCTAFISQVLFSFFFLRR